MAKITMYKGIDPTDGALSLFAVDSRGTVYPSTYMGNADSWLDSRQFIKELPKFLSVPIKDCPFDIDAAIASGEFEKVWEVEV